jgi:5-methylcytosine-specific restriction protein B
MEFWDKGGQEGLSEQMLAMQPGERIAIKATYTRKHGLPFDNRGHTVSVMTIKAVGTITENPNEGRRVKVEWAKSSQYGSGISTLIERQSGACSRATG